MEKRTGHRVDLWCSRPTHFSGPGMVLQIPFPVMVDRAKFHKFAPHGATAEIFV
jgi:hypothetical protein